MNLLLEGDNLEALLLRASREGGTAARIVRAVKVRRGGILGFFRREGFEVAVEIPQESAARTTADTAATTAEATAAEATEAGAIKAGGERGSLLELTDRANAQEEEAALQAARSAAFAATMRDVAPILPDQDPGDEPAEAAEAAQPTEAGEPAEAARPAEASEPAEAARPAESEPTVAAEPTVSTDFVMATFPQQRPWPGQAGLNPGLTPAWRNRLSGLNETGLPADLARVSDVHGPSDFAAEPNPANLATFMATSLGDDDWGRDDIDTTGSASTGSTPTPYPPDGTAAPGAPGGGYEPGSLEELAAAHDLHAGHYPDDGHDLDQEHHLDDGNDLGGGSDLGGVSGPNAAYQLDSTHEFGRASEFGQPGEFGARPAPGESVASAIPAQRRSMAFTGAGVGAGGGGMTAIEMSAPRATTIVPKSRHRRGGATRAARSLPAPRPASPAESMQPIQQPAESSFFTDTDTAEPAELRWPDSLGQALEPSQQVDPAHIAELSQLTDSAGLSNLSDLSDPVRPGAGPAVGDLADSADSAQFPQEQGLTDQNLAFEDEDEDDAFSPQAPTTQNTQKSSGLRTSSEAAWRLLRGWRPGARRRNPLADVTDEAHLRESQEWTPDDVELTLDPEQASVAFAQAATFGAVPAGAIVIETGSQLIADRLALQRLGIPASWTENLIEGDRFASIVSMLARLPEPTIPEDTAVIAVVGPADVVELEAHRTALDLPARGRPRAVTLVPGARGVDRRAAIARSKRIRPVVISIPVEGYDDAEGTRKLLDSVNAESVIAVVDATRPLAEISHWLQALGRVDALALDGALEVEAPATVLSLDVPVIRVDGISVDRIGWAALLCAQLAAMESPR